MSKSIRLLIDGYNLMFQSLVTKDSLQGSDALRLARQRLLQKLAQLIEPEIRPHTLIVFDAKDAPNGLPDRATHDHMTIVFARDWASADEWMQNAIRHHPTPKKLSVVSSDHSIRQKARARKAKVFDSEEWFIMQIESYQRQQAESKSTANTEPVPSEEQQKDCSVSSKEEQSQWLREFGYKE